MTAAAPNAELIDAYRAALIAALPLDTSDQTIEELSRGLDVVVEAVRAEAAGPVMSGDVLDAIDHAFDHADNAEDFVDHLGRRAFCVLERQKYDELVKVGQIAAAWVLDRADQYRNDSCCKVAVGELVGPLASGEHIEAYRHGELDDLLKRRCVSSVDPQAKGGEE